MQSIEVNRFVFNISDPKIIESFTFICIAYLAFKALLYIFKKVLHYFVYDNDFLKKYPVKKYKVIVVNDFSEYCLNDIINELINGNPPEFNVVGLDCEISSDTTNRGRPCPALLQMARPDGYCVIFQLKHITEVHSIMNILNNRATLLVGVGILHDVDNLNVGWGLRSQRCLDIRHLADNLGYEHPLSLQALASKVLKVNCKKNTKLGPWEDFPLTEKQISYAAKDAHLSVQIFMKLNNQKICQSFSKLKRLFWSENTYWKHSLSFWEKFIDKHFNPPQADLYLNYPLSSSCFPHTCSNISFQGQQIIIPECNPLSIERICVVCGLTDEREISLKAIVPLEYRVKFCPDLSHYLDLCKHCILKNQEKDFILRNHLADICGAPYPIYNTEELLYLKRLSKNILANKNVKYISDNFTKITVLFTRVCEQLQIACNELLTIGDIEVISNMDCWPYSSHASAVCDYYETDTEQLKNMWCDHFIDTMKPRFLPESWTKFNRKRFYC